MHTQLREHQTARPLTEAADPIGQIHDLFPVHPETTPRRPEVPRQRPRDRRQQQRQEQRRGTDDDESQHHVDDYA
jgi:hypothetical protein